MINRRLLLEVGMRLVRHPGSVVLSYQDERVPTGEPLIVTHVSGVGHTASLWLVDSERTETVHLSEIMRPDFELIGFQTENLFFIKITAAGYKHGRQIPIMIGMQLKRTGRPFSTFDSNVPYDTILTVTEHVYEDMDDAPPTDYVVFEYAEGQGHINGRELTDAYFEVID